MTTFDSSQKGTKNRQSHDTAQNSLTDDNGDYEDNKTYETTTTTL